MRPARSFLFITILFACVTGSTFLLPIKNLVPNSLLELKEQFFPRKEIPISQQEPIIPDILTDSVGFVAPTTASSASPTAAQSASPTVAQSAAPSVARNVDPNAVLTVTQTALSTATSTVASTKTLTAAPSIAPTVVPTTTSAAEPTVVSLLSPLKPFLDSLENSKGQVRVLYYGDSQIEGDRMSGFIRHELRDLKGGTGPGLVLPLMPVMFTKSVWVQSSPNWERFNYVSFSDNALSHKRFGPLLVFCRYLPENLVSETLQKAYVKIKPSYMADNSSAVFDRLRIFYNNSEGDVSVLVSSDNITIFSDTLSNAPGTQEITCELKGVSQVTIEFSGHTSPDIYGISVESENGVVVDNIPLRGSAGLEFTMVDSPSLKEGFDLLKPDLIVLQYGLNIVRNVRTDYTYFKKGIVRQLNVLKNVAPGTPVLIIGVTGMAEFKGDTLTPFDNIQSIINAQREAALEGGAAFWDASMAMGGNLSMEKWVTSGLMQKDFIHLSYSGADTLAKYLLDDILSVQSYKIDDNGLSPFYTENIQAGSNQQNGDQLANIAGIEVADYNAGDGDNGGAIAERILLNNQPNSGFFSAIQPLPKDIFEYDPNNPMGFNKLAFWVFFFVVLAFYSFLYKSPFPRNIYLLLVSLFFYYKTGGLFLLLLLFVILVNYCCALLMPTSNKKGIRKLFLAIGVITNLSILAYFKYTSFFVGVFNDLFGTSVPVVDYLAQISNNILGTNFDIDNIILPIGISFFLFQAISYIVDVYRNEISPVENIADFGFYISFFPQLVAGPIVRPSEFIPQISKPFSLTKREFSHALFLVYKGLIKKIVISDFIALNFVDRVFDMPASFSGFENLMAVYGYALQIYCDFSGYTDIAIGLALVMGFRIPVNFNSPYKAVDLGDFWRRWHISLSRWLKDYLYIPLGGNRKGSFITGVNLMITMLLGGLWHGASMKFIIWGGWHGIGLVLSKIKNKIVGRSFSVGRIPRLISLLLTFHFVCFGWVFFRSSDMNSAKVMLSQIFQSFSPGAYMDVIPAYASVFLLMGAGFIIHMLPERIKESYRGMFIRFPMVIQFIIVFMVTLLLLAMPSQGSMPFIYFRF